MDEIQRTQKRLENHLKTKMMMKVEFDECWIWRMLNLPHFLLFCNQDEKYTLHVFISFKKHNSYG